MATGFDKALFANPGFASAFTCINCKLICIDIRELSCNKGHLCCESCWNNIEIKQCPTCKNMNYNVDIKRSRFVEGQQSKLKMKCPNNGKNKCEWHGTFGLLTQHLIKHCLYRMSLCEHCNKSFIYKEFTIHRETCNYLKVSCPLQCNKTKKWLRMKITHHLKNECPNYVIKCDYFNNGCKEKLQRHKMINHLSFECEYRIVECPFIQYGCTQTAKMHYFELTKHLKQYQVKHISLKMVAICDEIQNIKHNMNEKFNEQSKQIEFLQKKLQFVQGGDDIDKKSQNMTINSLSNDCNGLLVFCGSKNGSDLSQNGVEWINIKNKTKHSLFCIDSLNDINRIYNHQYLHLKNKKEGEFKEEEKEKEKEKEDANKKEENDNLWDVQDMAVCCGYNIEFSSIQSYLLNSSFGNNTSGIDSIFKFKNREFWHQEKVTMIFRCGGWLSKTKEKLSRCDGCVLETNDWFQLPFMNEILYGTSIIYSHIHGLIVVGGKNNQNAEVNTVKRLTFNDNDNDILKWDNLPSMFIKRYSPSICLWEDIKSMNYNDAELLIVSGGWNKNKGDLKSCSIYDFNSKEWNEISDMNIARSLSTLIHWKYRNKCINVGGTSINVIASKSVEEYDLIKDQWYKLPNLNESHRKYPCVWIDNSLLYNSYNGILCVSGDNDLGSIEILDVRINKWQTVAHLSSFFQSDIYKNKVFRRVVCC